MHSFCVTIELQLWDPSMFLHTAVFVFQHCLHQVQGMAISWCGTSESVRKVSVNDCYIQFLMCADSHTVKLVFFACALFREFCNLGDVTKIKGHKYS